ncbi:MAG: hypothetical protein QNJ20_09135 [Paracoccaceae bacterium]|nr:hypothetical protein [Paracoccaceae bacterium]
MRFLQIILMCFSPVVAAANGLPLAENRYMGSVVIDDKTVPVDIGATVALVARDENGIPKPLEIEALVLGVEGTVVFLELDRTDAVRLAQAQAAGEVTLRQTATPNVETMAQRVDARRSRSAVYVAPHLRRFTVNAGLADDLEAFQQGAKVVVTREGSTRSVHRSPVFFLLAEESTAERFDVTLAAWEGAALSIFAAETEGELSISPVEPVAQQPDEGCYVRRRSAGRVVAVQIPCR